ncbi:MAG: extracellular solute-binding protein [Cyanobacteriota bacterium]|nr:extracellular solute-binding protein [Cyanobacteriota bacterium]
MARSFRQLPRKNSPSFPIDRRSFLVGTAALAVGQLVGGCNRNARETLSIELLNDSVPVQLLGKFRQQLSEPIVLDFSPASQFGDLFSLLQNLHEKSLDETEPPSGGGLPFFRRSQNTVPDLVMLGDYWLSKAIEWEFIEPMSVGEFLEWDQLSDEPIPWKALVTRDERGQLAEAGTKDAIWGAPYRWGTMAIAYRRDKFEELGWTPTDWSDLWRPELRHRISLPDSAREVIGLTLKTLGRSYNTKNLAEVADLEPKFQALHQQVKLYSSQAYLPPLLREDTWLAVAPSIDILSLSQYGREIAAVVPQSGTSLWADLWVRPARKTEVGSENESDVALWQRWIDFCWQTQIVSQLSLLTKAASPRLTGMQRGLLPENLQTDPVLLPPDSILSNSEFLNPLPDEAIDGYRELWVRVRSS